MKKLKVPNLKEIPMNNLIGWEDYGLRVSAIYPSEALIRFYMKNLSKINNPSVLELGCGGGRNTRFLSENTNKLTAIDGSKSCIAKTNSLIKNCGLNADVILSDVRYFDYKYNTFDAVIDVSTLQHITMSELKTLIPKIYLSLKDNGYFFSIFKNNDDYVYSCGENIDSSTRKYHERFDKISNPCILSFLTKDEIMKLFFEFNFLELNSDRWTYDNGNRLNSHWIISAQK